MKNSELADIILEWVRENKLCKFTAKSVRTRYNVENHGCMILLSCDREQLKSIRRGEWKEEDIRKWFEEKERGLEQVYLDSKLSHGPDEAKIKALLFDCLEHHYGSLEKCVVKEDHLKQALMKIRDTIDSVL